MKIFIQARKDGYNVLYPTPTTPTEFYQFASDIQSASANNDAIYYGKNFYSLAFASGGCIFTKYVIGYDIQRNNLGNVGISVFIPNTQKLSGNYVKILLDDLLNTYCRNYCLDNNISDKREDWILFTSLADSYDAKLLSGSTYNDNVATGTQDPSFYYYRSDSELIEHFDKPFQEEYSNYRQILFIDSNLQSASNPLNVIKNSGVEVNPDLNDEYYYLNNYNSSRGIKITANGKSRSDKKGENQIRAKWQVEIRYSKDYYKPIVVTGCISNPVSDIFKYLEINGNNIKIKYDAFLPDPETKTITFDVITKKDGVKISDAEIQISEYQGWHRLSEFTFKAEELGREFKIFARRGENLCSDVAKITPKDFKATSITLPLIEKRVVRIVTTEAEGEKNNILDFKVWVSGGKCNTQKVSEITFTGDEIDKTWNITVEKDGYTRSNSIQYYPKNGDNTIYFKLLKAQKRTPSDIFPRYENSSLEGVGKQKSLAAKAKRFFSKPAVIATSIVSLLVLALGIWTLYSLFGKDKQPQGIPLTAQSINVYVEGDSLFLNTLNDFRDNWKLQEQDFFAKSGGSIFGGGRIVDSTQWKSEWHPVNKSIERAISKREYINDKDFTKLKNLGYTNAQDYFKTAINKIDSISNDEVNIELGDVSMLTLTQIAKKINTILTLKESASQEQLEEPKKEEKKTEQDNNNPREKPAKPVEKPTSESSKSKETKPAAPSDLQQQDNFQKEFWKLVHDSKSSKTDFDKWVNKGSKISSQNEYKIFYDGYLSTTTKFEKYKNVPGRATINDLGQLKSNIK